MSKIIPDYELEEERTLSKGYGMATSTVPLRRRVMRSPGTYVLGRSGAKIKDGESIKEMFLQNYTLLKGSTVGMSDTAKRNIKWVRNKGYSSIGKEATDKAENEAILESGYSNVKIR